MNQFSTVQKKNKRQGVSPAGGFAQVLSEALPDQTIGFVVNARGGTTIEEWTKGAEAGYYEKAMKQIETFPRESIAGIL